MGFAEYHGFKTSSDFEYGHADIIIRKVSTSYYLNSYSATYTKSCLSNRSTSQAIVQKKLDNVQKTLDMILQEIRDGKHEASIGSSQTVDSLSTEKRQTWRAIGKELEDIGISLTPFDANKDFIMNWFKIAKSTGAFKEVAAEEDGSSKEDLSQSLEDPEHDTLSSQKTLEDPGRDAVG